MSLFQAETKVVIDSNKMKMVFFVSKVILNCERILWLAVKQFKLIEIFK